MWNYFESGRKPVFKEINISIFFKMLWYVILKKLKLLTFFTHKIRLNIKIFFLIVIITQVVSFIEAVSFYEISVTLLLSHKIIIYHS